MASSVNASASRSPISRTSLSKAWVSSIAAASAMALSLFSKKGCDDPQPLCHISARSAGLHLGSEACECRLDPLLQLRRIQASHRMLHDDHVRLQLAGLG